MSGKAAAVKTIKMEVTMGYGFSMLVGWPAREIHAHGKMGGVVDTLGMVYVAWI